MKKITLREAFLSLSIVLGLSIPASAQTQGKVLVFNTTDTKLSRVWNISDNGHFAVGSSLADGYTMYPFVWNLQNDSKFYLKDKNNATQECLNGDALDITNDGKIISGSYNNLPALYHSDTNTWTMLPIPEEYKANGVGTCSKMTPDGKSGIGMIYDNNTYFGTALYWKDGELVDVNLPEKNLFGGKVMISRFDDISADGEYLIGRLSYNEMPAASCAFIYKASSKEFKYIAEDFMKSVDPGGYLLDNHIEEMAISPDGKMVAGILYEEYYTGKEGEEYNRFAINAHNTGFTYNIEKDEFTSYKGKYEAFFAIDNNGVIYGVNNLLAPFRDAFVIKNGAYSDIAKYAKDEFGISDLQASVGYEDFSGTIANVSADGKAMVYNATLNGGLSYAIIPDTGITGIDQILQSTNGVDALLQGNTIQLKGDVKSVAVYSPLGIKLLETINPSQQISLANYTGVVLVHLTDISNHKVVKKFILK